MNKADVVYIHTEILSHKNKEILPFATIQMDLEGNMLSDRERQILYDYHLYVESPNS